MIYAYPMDRTGCGKYRITWPAEVLIARGAPITLIGPGEDGGISAKLNGRKEVTGVVIPDDCDTVVLQRPDNETLVDTIPFLKREGIRVIVEIDDDLAAVSSRHPGWLWMHPKTDTGRSWKAVEQACEWADVVVASTPALLSRYAKHGRGVVIRNCLPDHFFDFDFEKDEDVTVGWGGAIISHPDDLRVVGPSLAQLRIKAKIVGPVPIDLNTHQEAPEKARRLLGVDAEFTGPVEFEEWIPAIGKLHVGLAPLEMTRFNVGKSWLKPLEYSVAGVPFVASNTPEYIELGAGLIADKPKAWRVLLKRLIDSELFRAEEAERNFKIAEQCRVSDHADSWREVWEG